MSLLKVWFPPAFFDVMPHLLLHLVNGLDWLGPVHSRWCYGAERYLFVFKKYFRNRAIPEASIAKGYMYAEALGYMSTHLSLYPGWKKIWDPDDNARYVGEVLEGVEVRRLLRVIELRGIYEFIICNLKATENLIGYVHIFVWLVSYRLNINFLPKYYILYLEFPVYVV